PASSFFFLDGLPRLAIWWGGGGGPILLTEVRPDARPTTRNDLGRRRLRAQGRRSGHSAWPERGSRVSALFVRVARRNSRLLPEATAGGKRGPRAIPGGLGADGTGRGFDCHAC